MKSENNIAITDELIAKYLSGESSPDEAMALSAWLELPDNKVHFDGLESAWLRSNGVAKPSFDKTKAWQRSQPKEHATKTIPLTTNRSRLYLKIAASIAAIVMIGALYFINNNGIGIRLKNMTTSQESESHIFTDKSEVTLYRNSAITYPEQFKGNTREVKLVKGEAFFRISPDVQKPFIVHTDHGDIRVVGTEFNVITSKNKTEVSVKEGKVMVYTSADSVTLTKGSIATVSQSVNEIALENAVDANVWGYATRKLVFKDTPVKVVIENIERAYPCAINLKNKNIEKCHFTATFDNDSVDKIVNLVAEILNLTVSKHDKTFTLEGEGCP